MTKTQIVMLLAFAFGELLGAGFVFQEMAFGWWLIAHGAIATAMPVLAGVIDRMKGKS